MCIIRQNICMFFFSLFFFGPFLSFFVVSQRVETQNRLSIKSSLFSFVEAPKRSLSFDDDDDDVWTGKTVRKGRGLREGARFFSCSSCCCSRDFFFFFRESDDVAFQNAIGERHASSFSSERITNFRHHQNSPSSHRIFDDTISNRYPAETMTRNRRFQK